MTLRRTISAQDLALAIDAAVALEIETHPHRLLTLAEEITVILPSLAEDLVRKARQGVRMRLMMARASLGNLIDLHEEWEHAMPPPHLTRTPFVAALWAAKTALEEEVDPGALRAAAAGLRRFVVEHPLAIDLDAKAIRGEAIRELFARACRGEV